MKFFIIDDDPAVRSMLTQIIEDEDLGQVVGEAEDGSSILQIKLRKINTRLI